MRKFAYIVLRMYKISHADRCRYMYHKNRCIQEQFTARWDASLAGLPCRVHALLRRSPIAVACRVAVRHRSGIRSLPCGMQVMCVTVTEADDDPSSDPPMQ